MALTHKATAILVVVHKRDEHLEIIRRSYGSAVEFLLLEIRRTDAVLNCVASGNLKRSLFACRDLVGISCN